LLFKLAQSSNIHLDMQERTGLKRFQLQFMEKLYMKFDSVPLWPVETETADLSLIILQLNLNEKHV
jgi:hypothetical protein